MFGKKKSEQKKPEQKKDQKCKDCSGSGIQVLKDGNCLTCPTCGGSGVMKDADAEPKK